MTKGETSRKGVCGSGINIRSPDIVKVVGAEGNSRKCHWYSILSQCSNRVTEVNGNEVEVVRVRVEVWGGICIKVVIMNQMVLKGGAGAKSVRWWVFTLFITSIRDGDRCQETVLERCSFLPQAAGATD